MKSVRLTLKNYRGFSDTNPVVFEIGPGFTSFLGKNNAGKSSAKLFFYELRPILHLLSQNLPQVNPSGYLAYKGGSYAFPGSYPGVTDVKEIFHNEHARPLSFEVEILDSINHERADYISRLVGTCDPRAPQSWEFRAYRKGSNKAIPRNAIRIAGPGVLVLDGVGEISCDDMFEVMEAFATARYYGPFRNAINQGAADHYDLKTGTAFIELWSTWKTSGQKYQLRAIDDVTESIRSLFEFKRLEINASSSLNTLIVSIDGQPYRLGELGSGIAQFIMVLGNAATSRPSLLLIDEPETNLHPALQIDFLLAVGKYAQNGCVFSTHSVGLARSVSDRIYSFQKTATGIRVAPFDSTPNYVEFIGALSFSAFKELGNDRVLLVEGVNDVKAVQAYLRLVKKEHSTIIIPLGGDSMAAGGRDSELQELTRLSGHVCALVDSERAQQADPPSQRRQEFAATCKKIGIDVCVTDKRAIENYFTDEAVKLALGASFAALGPFQLLRQCPKPWSKTDNWKIARHMTWDDIKDTDIGKFLDRI